MSIQIVGDVLERVKIIDDEPKNREVWAYPVEDLDLDAVLEVGPIIDKADFVNDLKRNDFAAICDHHLKSKQYSNYDGAELVSEFTQAGVSSILVTRYEGRVEELRRFRKYIPVLMNPHELSPDTLALGLETCALEIRGVFTQARKLRRTLIRVESVFDEANESNPYIDISIPSWNSSSVHRILLSELPEGAKEILTPDSRFHAYVNIGAEDFDDLYFDQWELK